MVLRSLDWEEIRVKSDSTGSNDFYSMPLINMASDEYSTKNPMFDRIEAIEKARSNMDYSIEMETEVRCRDGLYEDDQLFCIFEKDDIQMIITLLNKCLIIAK